MVNFATEGLPMPDIDIKAVNKWIETVALGHGFSVGRLSYLFCDDEYILDANRKFLGHDYYTDIITFDYTSGCRISGDMIISLDTVRSNARDVGDTFENELHRVIIHGVLHLCGIDDKGPGEREIMEREEDKALSCLLRSENEI